MGLVCLKFQNLLDRNMVIYFYRHFYRFAIFFPVSDYLRLIFDHFSTGIGIFSLLTLKTCLLLKMKKKITFIHIFLLYCVNSKSKIVWYREGALTEASVQRLNRRRGLQ